MQPIVVTNRPCKTVPLLPETLFGLVHKRVHRDLSPSEGNVEHRGCGQLGARRQSAENATREVRHGLLLLPHLSPRPYREIGATVDVAARSGTSPCSCGGARS